MDRTIIIITLSLICYGCTNKIYNLNTIQKTNIICEEDIVLTNDDFYIKKMVLYKTNLNNRCDIEIENNNIKLKETISINLVQQIQTIIPSQTSTQSYQKTEKRRYIDWKKVYVQLLIISSLLIIGTLIYFYWNQHIGTLILYSTIWFVLYYSKII